MMAEGRTSVRQRDRLRSPGGPEITPRFPARTLALYGWTAQLAEAGATDTAAAHLGIRVPASVRELYRVPQAVSALGMGGFGGVDELNSPERWELGERGGVPVLVLAWEFPDA